MEWKTISGSMKRRTEWNIIIIFFDVVDQCHELSKQMWSNICVRIYFARSLSLPFTHTHLHIQPLFFTFLLLCLFMLSVFHSFTLSLFHRISIGACVYRCHWNGGSDVGDSTYAHAYSIIITFVWFMAKRQVEGERCGDYCYLFSFLTAITFIY